MTYKMSVFLIFSILATYLLVSLYLGQVAHREVYPFFSWTLFSRVPQPDEPSYRIRILSLNGRSLPSPSFYIDKREEMTNQKRVLGRDNYIVTMLGISLDEDRYGQAEEFRRTFEKVLAVSSTVYEVIKIKPHQNNVDNLNNVEILNQFTFNNEN